MTDRCEPADTSRDGWHYVQRNPDPPRYAEWIMDWGWSGLGANREPTVAARAGYRYLMPVPTFGQITALVEGARALDHFAWSMVSLPNAESRVYLQSLIDAQRAALAPFQQKDTADG